MTDIARISGPEYNADLTDLVTIHSHLEPWANTRIVGVDEKLFERISHGPNARETGLARFAPGATLNGGPAQCRIDLFVLEGAVDLNGSQLAAGWFARVAKGTQISVASTDGATMLIKKRSGAADGEAMALDTKDRANWEAWGGRGSEKAQLFDAGALQEASWVGFMLPDLTIPEHSHAGGEEIFILDGALRDERGFYGPGAWVRFPVGVTHTPTSLDDGCLMLVREGDAVAVG